MKKHIMYLYGWFFVRPRRWFFRKVACSCYLRIFPKKEPYGWLWPNIHWFLLYKTVWRFFRWLYWDAWRKLCRWEDGGRSSFPPMARFVHWIGRTTVGEHIFGGECWHCGFEAGDPVDLADDETGTTFILQDSGTYGTQDGTTHWFRGETICPVCGYRKEYEDSD